MPASPLSKQNPPPPPPLKRAPQLAPNRSEPPAQMPKITSFTSTNPLQQQSTQPQQQQQNPASNSEHQSPRIPKNGEKFNLYLNNKLPMSKVFGFQIFNASSFFQDDFTVDKHQGINLASNVDKGLLEYFIRIFLNNTNRDVIKFSKLTEDQQDFLEAIADKHDLGTRA